MQDELGEGTDFYLQNHSLIRRYYGQLLFDTGGRIFFSGVPASILFFTQNSLKPTVP
jgi:hypothetical protein